MYSKFVLSKQKPEFKLYHAGNPSLFQAGVNLQSLFEVLQGLVRSVAVFKGLSSPQQCLHVVRLQVDGTGAVSDGGVFRVLEKSYGLSSKGS